MITRLLFLIFVVFLLLIIVIHKYTNYESIKNEKVNDIISKFMFIKNDISIPKVIHKIYIDQTMTLNNIDDNIKNLFEKLQKDNKDYKIKIWSGNDCREYIKNNFSTTHLECFDGLKPYAFKADFARYCILYNEGGWYSDIKEQFTLAAMCGEETLSNITK